ncbi:TerB family tellurite resistance protein [Desulfosarcina sp. OttesenSCG-928-G10]|nr:TerB family tellurite resistance protein [Desulfosarcina sp. OttesenSCG-928-G10]
MGWKGKIIGGAIGFFFGGPLGAILGTVVGHAVDTGAELDRLSDMRGDSAGQQARPSGRRPWSLEKQQLTFFVAAFSMLAKLSKADGRVSAEEISSVEAFIHQDLRLDAQRRHMAIEIFRTALKSPVAFEDFARQFHRQFSRQPQMHELMIDILLRVAVADGTLTDGEEALILSAVQIFGFSQVRYRQLRDQYIDTADKAYAVLGCSPGDSDAEVKRCYRQKVQEYHPDKIASRGLPPDFTRLAEEKFREIQDAWEQIKAARNIA